MKKKEGKTQSYSREYNTKLVLSSIIKGDKSANDLFLELNLSNATMYTILNSLLNEGLITAHQVEETPNKKAGRKQVIYSLNKDYGLILGFYVANYKFVASIYNLKGDILECQEFENPVYSRESLYELFLQSNTLLMKYIPNGLSLKSIVFSVPGRVNRNDNTLLLSKTFPQNVIDDTQFISDMFNRLYPGVPRKVYNFNDCLAIAEMEQGILQNTKNAVFISIDNRINGSFIGNGKPFEGDHGYAGELANFKVLYGEKRDYLKKIISFEYLYDQINTEFNVHVKTAEELIDLYKTNDDVKKYICTKVDILGRVLANLAEWFDVSNIVIGGRAAQFDEDYLNAIRKPMEHLDFVPNVTYSMLGEKGKHIGLAKIGRDVIIKNAIAKIVK